MHKISIKSDSYRARSRSIKFSQNWLSNLVMSQILLDVHFQCPTDLAISIILQEKNTEKR